MSTTAGRVPIKFGDGKVRFIPAGKVDTVLAHFKDAVVQKTPRPSLFSSIGALSKPETYSSPGRAAEVAGDVGSGMYDLTAENMPAILATAATLPLGGIGGFAGPALRTGAGATAMYGGSLAGDVMQGRAPNLDEAAQSFGAGMALGPASELAGAGVKRARSALTESAFRPTEQMLKRSPTIIDDLQRAKVKIRKPGEEAVEARAAKRASRGRTRRMVTGSTASISSDDALAQVIDLRNGIAQFAPTDARLPLIDTYIAEFRNKWGAGRIPVSDAHQMKIKAQREASSKFAKEGDSPATVQELNKLVAQDVRMAIGRELPSSAGRPGYNAQDRATQRAHQMIKAAERAPRLRRPAAIPAHLVATAAGGAGGYGAHGLEGGAGGVLALNALVSALENPFVANRLALLLGNPAISAGLRSAPYFAEPLVSPLIPGSQRGRPKDE